MDNVQNCDFYIKIACHHKPIDSIVILTVVLPPASAADETSGALNFSAAAT
jgi:hypothetical protein